MSCSPIRPLLALVLLLQLAVACRDRASTESVGVEDSPHGPFREGIAFVFDVPEGQEAAVQQILCERLDAFGVQHGFEDKGPGAVVVLLPVEARPQGEGLKELLGRRGVLRLLPVDADATRQLAERVLATAAEAGSTSTRFEAGPDGLVANAVEGDPLPELKAAVERVGTELSALREVVTMIHPRVDRPGRSAVALVVALDDDAVTTVHVARASVDRADDGEPFVLVELEQADAEEFLRLTRSHVEQKIAVVVDDEVLIAPVVREPISGGRLRITMGHGEPAAAEANARRIAAVLSAAALPVPVRLVGAFEGGAR